MSPARPSPGAPSRRPRSPPAAAASRTWAPGEGGAVRRRGASRPPARTWRPLSGSRSSPPGFSLLAPWAASRPGRGRRRAPGSPSACSRSHGQRLRLPPAGRGELGSRGAEGGSPLASGAPARLRSSLVRSRGRRRGSARCRYSSVDRRLSGCARRGVQQGGGSES